MEVQRRLHLLVGGLFCSACPWIGFLAAGSVLAEEPPTFLRSFMPQSEGAARSPADGENVVKFRMRLIRGQGTRDHSSEVNSVMSLHEPDRQNVQRVDPALADLGASLRELPYRTFRLVQSSSEAIPLLRKEVLSLDDGSVLMVRPLSIEATDRGHRATLWLRWNDRSGESILDTRVQLRCGTPIIAGTEGLGTSGMILALELGIGGRKSDEALP